MKVCNYRGLLRCPASPCCYGGVSDGKRLPVQTNHMSMACLQQATIVHGLYIAASLVQQDIIWISPSRDEILESGNMPVRGFRYEQYHTQIRVSSTLRTAHLLQLWKQWKLEGKTRQIPHSGFGQLDCHLSLILHN